jgi:hypothetical protein
MTNDLTTLGEAIAATIDTLIDNHGFTFPIYMVSIGINGGLVAAYYDGPAQEPRFVAEYMPEPRGLVTPINCIFVNSGDGRAAKMVIESDGQPRWEM